MKTERGVHIQFCIAFNLWELSAMSITPPTEILQVKGRSLVALKKYKHIYEIPLFS